MENPELRDLSVKWVELPTPGSGRWFLQVDVVGGNGHITSQTLTLTQALTVADVANNPPR